MGIKPVKHRAISWLLLGPLFWAIIICGGMVEHDGRRNTDYIAKINELGRAGRPEGLNAAMYYKKAFELAVEKPKEITSLDIKAWPTDLPQDKKILVQNWVGANNSALGQLELAVEKPYYWPEYEGNWLGGVELPPNRKLTSLVRAISLRAKLAAEKGDFKKAFSDILTCYKWGNHLTGPKPLTEQLLGGVIRSVAVHAAFQVIDNQEVDAHLLKAFQEELQRVLDEESQAIDPTFDEFRIYEIIEETFTNKRNGDGQISETLSDEMESLPKDLKAFLLEILSELTEEQLAAWTKMERQETSKLTRKTFEYMRSAAQRTPAELLREGKDPAADIKEMTQRNPLLSIFTENYPRAIEMSFLRRVETDALVTTIAVFRYESDRGEYPVTLAELIAANYMKSLSGDPFGNRTLVYKQTDHNFILYSFGPDFDDDGGVPSTRGEGENDEDQVFWPVQRQW